MSKLLKSQAVGLPKVENQHGRTFEETCWVHICICKKAKYRKVVTRKVATSRKKQDS